VLIDWFTVIAQMINFLVLVALLRYFLFTPIVSAMRERREKIEGDMDNAKQREDEAGKMLEGYKQKSLELDRQREGIIRKAEEEARKRGDDYLRQVRADAASEQERLREALNLRKRDFGMRLRLMALHDAAGMARRTLGELSGASLEDGLVSVFIRQIESTDKARREQVAQAMRERGNSPEIKSSFPLREDLRRKLDDAIRKQFSPQASVKYQPVPDMPLGIEMDVDGYKLRWGVDQYLGDLEEEISKAISDAFGAQGEEGHA
jgi:F-type H+-transporting ATPase subunit b